MANVSVDMRFLFVLLSCPNCLLGESSKRLILTLEKDLPRISSAKGKSFVFA